jgi:hypothetical protein
MALDKTFRPDTTMTFVGYELDYVATDKILKARELLNQFLQSNKQKVRLRDLQSIVGFLNFTCAVVLPGQAFLRRLIDLTIRIRKPYNFIRINSQARHDMYTWLKFLNDFNGRSLFLPDRWVTSPSLHLFTDSSARLGYGAVLGDYWFY